MKGALRKYVNDMVDAFSLKFILFMFVVQCFLNGIVFMTINGSLFPLLKSLKVDAARLQILSTLAMAPWSLKPLMGMLSDIVALGRYHKRYWLLAASFIGVVGASFLSTGTIVIPIIVMMMFCLHYQVSNCDLLVEGKYAELMRENPHTGSNIVTLKSGFQQFGFIIAMSFVGPLADAKNFTAMFIVCLCFATTPIIPLVLGWLPEKKLPDRRKCSVIIVDKEKVRKSWKMLIFVALIGLTGPTVSLVLAFSTINRAIGICIALGVVLIGVIGGYLSFPRVIANVALYQVLTSLSKISVGTALDFFFTASPRCLPNGPHFSFKYYITFTGILGTCVSFISVFVYQLLFSKWRFRNVLLFTTFLACLSGIFDFILVKRWNVFWGIPDKYFYILGDAILENALQMMYWIPSSAIIAKVCPSGLEAATYAFLAGMSNFARTVASLAGALAIDWLHLRMTEHDTVCNWSNLWVLVLFGHILLPLVVGILAAIFLIPNTKQTDSLKDNPHNTTTTSAINATSILLEEFTEEEINEIDDL